MFIVGACVLAQHGEGKPTHPRTGGKLIVCCLLERAEDNITRIDRLISIVETRNSHVAAAPGRGQPLSLSVESSAVISSKQ